MNNDRINPRGTPAERVNRIEQAVESLRIIKCEECHDGGVALIEFPALNGSIRPSDGPYDANGKCRTCGRVCDMIIRWVIPGMPNTGEGLQAREVSDP